jgi:hypothetical protein
MVFVMHYGACHVVCSPSPTARKSVNRFLQCPTPNQIGKPSRKMATTNPFTSLRGTGNRKLTTEQIMRMTRGDDWNRA